MSNTILNIIPESHEIIRKPYFSVIEYLIMTAYSLLGIGALLLVLYTTFVKPFYIVIIAFLGVGLFSFILFISCVFYINQWRKATIKYDQLYSSKEILDFDKYKPLHSYSFIFSLITIFFGIGYQFSIAPLFGYNFVASVLLFIIGGVHLLYLRVINRILQKYLINHSLNKKDKARNMSEI